MPLGAWTELPVPRSLLFIASLLLLPLSPAQTPVKRDPGPGILRSITIHGQHLYAEADIIAQSGLQIGQRVTSASFEQARQNIQKTDLFATTSYQYKFEAASTPQYDLTLTVVEDEQVFPMHFERLGADPEKIRAYLKAHVKFYSDTIPGTEPVVNRYKQAVQEFVASVKVKANVARDENGQLNVVFYPDAPIPTISQVLVYGNESIDTGTLLRAINEVSIGVPLTDARVKMILDGAIKPVYAAHGYPMVTFPKIETEPAKTNSGVILKVTILDGPQFKFGTIRFRGKGLEEDEVRSNITFKPGDVFNGAKLDAFRWDLLHRMKRRGLLDASINADTEPDEAKHVINVVYNVVPGEAYKFNKLDIQGLDMNSQPVIEKMWGEKPGQSFNPDYPDFFLKRVQEQGLFDNLAKTTSDYSAEPATHLVTVHLYFKGGESAEDKKRKKQEEEDKRRGGGAPYPYGG
jgi:outer membrane protein assembly factor BamA